MINSLVLGGNICKDAEFKNFDNGVTVCRFRLAVNDYQNGQQVPLYIDVTVFGKQAEGLAPHLIKGLKVVAQGRLTSHKYTNKDGIEVTVYEMIANSVEFVARKNEGEEKPEEEPQAQQQPRKTYSKGYSR